MYGYRFWEVAGLTLTDDLDLPPREEVPKEHWIRRVDGIPIQVPNEGAVITGLNMERGIAQVCYPNMERALPIGVRKVKHSTMDAKVPSKLWTPNGSICYFGSKQQSMEQYEGVRYHWAWVDEPIPRYIFNGLWRGLQFDLGPIWFTLTPLGPNAIWLKEWLMLDDVWASYKGTQAENPYLTDQGIKDFEKGEFGKRERIARTTGEFEQIGGQVLHNFRRDVHVIKGFEIPPGWIIGQTVDPHHKKAAFISWWAIDPATEPNYVYHFFREWPNEDFFRMERGAMSPSEYATLFRQIEGARPAQIRLCDPRFGKAEWSVAGQHQSTIWSEEMARAGLYYETRIPGVSRLEIGHMRITELLRFDDQFPLGPSNMPHIVIHDTCPNLIKGCEYYAYVEIKDAERGVVEKVSEEFKDPVDTIRYTVLYPLGGLGQQDMGNFSERDLMEENQDGFPSAWW
jgi:hypothetical protein